MYSYVQQQESGTGEREGGRERKRDRRETDYMIGLKKSYGMFTFTVSMISHVYT
jgi:hypothetical protein